MQKQSPKLIVVAGPNGSGKTSLTISLSSHHWFSECRYINADNIAQKEYGDWNSLDAVLKAAQQAQNEREDCLLNGRSFAFETVFSGLDKVDFIERAKSAGYFVRLFFVGTDSPKINASRVAQRVMEGGHDVPISKIISRYTKSIANCAKVIKSVDRAYIYDNSVDDVYPSLMFRSENGLISKQYAPEREWSASIHAAVSTPACDVLKSPEPRPKCS